MRNSPNPITTCGCTNLRSPSQAGDGDPDGASEVPPRRLALPLHRSGGERQRGRQRAAVGRQAEEGVHGHPRAEREERAGEGQVRPVGRGGVPHLRLGGKKIQLLRIQSSYKVAM